MKDTQVSHQSGDIPPLCLTVAGSDPGGGAGIQGDLKAFAAHGVYGMAVITALTAQNTVAVTGVSAVEPDFVRLQLETIYEDMPPRFVKTGMLLNAQIIEVVADFFEGRMKAEGDGQSGPNGPNQHNQENQMIGLTSPTSPISLSGAPTLIIDPVMISSSGSKLLEDDAIAAYVERLFPLAQVITPNNLETQHFTGIAVASVDEAVQASEKLLEMGARAVVVKGGDTQFREASDKLFDVLNDNGEVHVFERPLVGSRNSHGTGCAYASAICAQLALGRNLASACDLAGQYVGGALRHAFATGQGSGSINHLWNNCFKELP